MDTVYNEIKEFLKDPIKNREAFFNSKVITWIDWREYDEDIIGYFNGLLAHEDIIELETKEIDLGRGIDLILKKDNKVLTIPYEDDETDRDITIKTLDEFISPKYQIRLFSESLGDDTLAFTILNSDEWKDLENEFGKEKLEFFFTPVSQFKGIFNMSMKEVTNNTWLWAWENINGFDDKIISLAREIKAKGEKLNLEALTTAEIEITDELNGHILSIVACGLADKKYCYYRGPHSGGAIFVAFDGVDERVFAPINAKDFADIVVNSIQQFPLNHKLFVESFLEWNKTKYKWKENTLIADFENSQKLEIDFEEKSELARIINIRLNS